jgi:methylmalonyl-CoA mutase cobalamin-binding subunit
MAMASTDQDVALVVSVDDDHLDHVAEVEQRLRAAGMHVERSLPTIGTISGSAPADVVQALRSTEGVANVEKSREYQLAPPESPIQ